MWPKLFSLWPKLYPNAPELPRLASREGKPPASDGTAKACIDTAATGKQVHTAVPIASGVNKEGGTTTK